MTDKDLKLAHLHALQTYYRYKQRYYYGDAEFRELCIRQACDRYISGKASVEELERVLDEILDIDPMKEE